MAGKITYLTCDFCEEYWPERSIEACEKDYADAFICPRCKAEIDERVELYADDDT